METVTNAASNVASVASRAIWGDSTKNDTNETAGKEPISGEVGNVKAGEPYDKGNEEESTSTSTAPEPKSLTKTTSKEIPSADSTTDLPTTSAQKLTSPTETLATTQIEPLKDAKDSKDPIGGVTGLVPQVKTEADTTSGAAEKVDKLTLKEDGEKTAVKDLKTDVTAANSTSTTSTPAGGKTSTSASDEKDKDKDHKLSLKEKIKAKLHHNKH